MVCFSAVLLALVFHNRIEAAPSVSVSASSSSRELLGGYYLVNFSATGLIFVSSWSSSVAPILVGLATALWLFPSTASLLKHSLEEKTSTNTVPGLGLGFYVPSETVTSCVLCLG